MIKKIAICFAFVLLSSTYAQAQFKLGLSGSLDVGLAKKYNIGLAFPNNNGMLDTTYVKRKYSTGEVFSGFIEIMPMLQTNEIGDNLTGFVSMPIGLNTQEIIFGNFKQALKLSLFYNVAIGFDLQDKDEMGGFSFGVGVSYNNLDQGWRTNPAKEGDVNFTKENENEIDFYTSDIFAKTEIAPVIALNYYFRELQIMSGIIQTVSMGLRFRPSLTNNLSFIELTINVIQF